ncbi:hypothetical protein B9Z55_028659 [Caenorhabditis nigoni]|uniref:Uncharacterized protein n=1 Tax=Caenorhabditis nigoni TaxID=1611254 RepID=A0A2G5SAK4_9PELO|nr:hypothetical protein B9Z55_028659 [Caenorhabditis nigoni]
MDQIVIQREGLPKNPPYSMPDTKVDEAKINEQWLLDLLCDQGKDQDLEMDFKKSLFAWNDTLLTGERLQVWIHKENKPFFDKRSQMSKMRRMLQVSQPEQPSDEEKKESIRMLKTVKAEFKIKKLVLEHAVRELVSV